jgi:hypothetical protein
VRKRLLAQDNIGIVPGYNSLHRANQHYAKEKDVFDVMFALIQREQENVS